MAQLKKPTIKNPTLVAAMAEFKQLQNKQTEQAMLEAIKEASFIAPISLQTSLDEVEPDENGQRQLQASLMAVSNKDSAKFFPAFTDWLEFLKWKNDPEAETMVITFDQYCDILLKQNIDIRGIVINPAETNIVIQRNKMAEMKGVQLNQTQANPNRSITALFGAEKITNPNVIIAAAKLKEENSAKAQNELFEVMRKARFVAPVLMELPKNAKAGEKVSAQAEFIMINHGDKKYMPLFTSLSELQKWVSAPSCKAVPMSMANYTAMLSDQRSTAAGIVLDPFTMGLSFSKEQALAIQPQLVVQDLKNIPMDLVSELKEYFKGIPEVKTAYLNGVKANGTDGYVIVLELTPGADVRTIADSTAEIAKKYNSPCAVAPLNSPIGQKATEGKVPFYEA